jgi:hypothetical protein
MFTAETQRRRGKQRKGLRWVGNSGCRSRGKRAEGAESAEAHRSRGLAVGRSSPFFSATKTMFTAERTPTGVPRRRGKQKGSCARQGVLSGVRAGGAPREQRAQRRSAPGASERAAVLHSSLHLCVSALNSGFQSAANHAQSGELTLISSASSALSGFDFEFLSNSHRSLRLCGEPCFLKAKSH